jgi:pyruvate dehydrogenase E1 component alpha subunit
LSPELGQAALISLRERGVNVRLGEGASLVTSLGVQLSNGENIPGRTVDGMNLFEVREAGEWAVEHARSGQGPVLLHVKTYRYRGHSMSDPAKYRSKEEVEEVREHHDPIEAIHKYILENGVLDEAGFKDIDKEVKEIVADAVEFAQTSPEPDPAELYTDVLIETN